MMLNKVPPMPAALDPMTNWTPIGSIEEYDMSLPSPTEKEPRPLKLLATFPFSAQLVADTIYERVMNPRNFVKIAPPFPLEHPAFFEEWYYYFKRNMGWNSEVFRVYLLAPLGTTAPRLIGSRDQIKRARSEILRTFSTAIKRHLGPEYMSFFFGDTVDRQMAETTIMESMESHVPEAELWRILRYNELRAKAEKGNISPYLNHLIATGRSEQEIWRLVMEIIMRKKYSEKKLWALNKAMQRHQKEVAPLFFRVRDLIRSLEQENLLFVKVKPLEYY